MNRDDPEQRIDELERQLDEARKQADDQPPPQFSDTGPIPIPGVAADRLPSDARARRNARFQAHARAQYPLIRQKAKREKLIGAILGWLGVGVGLWVFLLVSSLVLVPSTALWTSDLVCSSTHHLEYDKNTFGASSSVTFRCVDGDSSYRAVGPVFAVQAIAVALVAAVVTAIVFLIWRGVRKRKF